MWTWECPNCKETIVEAHEIEVVKQHIGSTHDCPECGYTVQIEPDLTCSDFGETLVKAYKEMGVTITKEQALGGFIDI